MLKAVVSLQSHNAGARYFEVRLDSHNHPFGGSSPGGQDVYVGLSAENPPSGFMYSADAFFAGSYGHSGLMGTNLPETPQFSVGDVIGIAVFFGEESVRVWASINGEWMPGGVVYDEDEGADVWTGTGAPGGDDGGEYPTADGMPLGEYWAFSGVTFDDFQVTLHETAAQLTYSPPAGYVPWRD